MTKLLGGKKLFLNMFTSSIYYIGTWGPFIKQYKYVPEASGGKWVAHLSLIMLMPNKII